MDCAAKGRCQTKWSLAGRLPARGATKGLRSFMDTVRAWKAQNVTWRQAVPVWKQRKVWRAVAENFRLLEGSWPGAARKMAAIFQGAPRRDRGRGRTGAVGRGAALGVWGFREGERKIP
jgi:hypothetical protein